MTVSFRVLGPMEVRVGDAELPLGGPKQRAVLALLLVDHGHVVSVDFMLEALWGEEAAESSRNILQVYVSNLRRILEPVAHASGSKTVIETRRPGYAADIPNDSLDLDVFERLAAAARRSVSAGDVHKASSQLAEALALWRGAPLADLTGEEAVAGAITRLESARLVARTDRIELEISLGNHTAVLDELAELVERQPYDERLRGLLMVSLYGAGRQADALTAFQEGRRLLVDELGVEPGPDLRRIEAMILNQASELAARPAARIVTDLSTIIGSSVLAPRASVVIGDRRIPIHGAVTTLGRRADRTIVVDDTKASRNHAEIRMSAGEFVLVDVGSTNGTRLNETRLSEPSPLKSGDEIGIGSTILRFEQE